MSEGTDHVFASLGSCLSRPSGPPHPRPRREQVLAFLESLAVMLAGLNVLILGFSLLSLTFAVDR